MATNVLWFVMAGFLLGFATSTLWEWFYFRKQRLKLTDRRIRELEAKVRDAESDTDSISSTEPASKNPISTVASVTGSSPRTSAWGDTSYRSPGVFLESEELPDDADNPPLSQDRARLHTEGTPPLSPYVPTVNSITNSNAPTSPPAPHSTPHSTSHLTQSAAQPSTPLSSAAIPPDPGLAGREEQQSPADALRAKRNANSRSRQEVLAELRRNSEAMRRGQLPPSEEGTAQAATQNAVAPRPSTLVSPTSPAISEPPVQSDPPEQSGARPASPAFVPSQDAAPPQSAARQRWASNLALTQRTKEYPDDLSKIKGIGDVYKQRLYRAGIYTWKQIAETDEQALRRAVSANQSSNISEWYGQAEKLMEKHGRRDAVYTGPPPDDMTKILGIGPVGASVLYRAGICTYEQLASTSIPDLATLFPLAVAGDQPDFPEWIARAEKLADQKHENV